jgi:hypothetical protein
MPMPGGGPPRPGGGPPRIGGGPNARAALGTTTAVPSIALTDRVRRVFRNIVGLLSISMRDFGTARTVREDVRPSSRGLGHFT